MGDTLALATQRGEASGSAGEPKEIIEGPLQYEFCDADHVVLLVSDVVTETAAMDV